MFGNKKILCNLIGALTFAASGQALAQKQEMVMLKIHDIVPVKNDKGETTSCEFFTTIFNRTGMNLNELTINFSWDDKAVENTITQEKALGRRETSMTEKYVPTSESASLSIPVLQVNSQKTMKGRVNSDRCFLLTQEPKLDIPSCSPEKPGGEGQTGAPRGKISTPGQSGFSCGAMFRYISPKDPQYYTDFMAVTIEEQDEVDQKAIARQGEELDSMFRNTEVNMNKIIKTIDAGMIAPQEIPAAIPAPVMQPEAINPSPAANTPAAPEADTNPFAK